MTAYIDKMFINRCIIQITIIIGIIILCIVLHLKIIIMVMIYSCKGLKLKKNHKCNDNNKLFLLLKFKIQSFRNNISDLSLIFFRSF